MMYFYYTNNFKNSFILSVLLPQQFSRQTHQIVNIFNISIFYEKKYKFIKLHTLNNKNIIKYEGFNLKTFS